jgi:predicted Zn-dependent protease
MSMSGVGSPGLSRRAWCGGLGATLATLAGGCGGLAISPDEERKLGRDEAEEVERTVGLVREDRLVGYVRQLGDRLARLAERPDVTWQFNVADDAEANAFALPGGWVYVTRGLLALLNSEDELVGVLGHEMAHVLERHAVRRVGVATPFALLFGVPAGILGTVSPTLGGIVGGTGRLASGLALAPYSREQEHDADRRGLGLAAHAGWDPSALASFLRTLERAEALTGRSSDRLRFFATHPATPERVSNVQEAARAQARGPRAAVAPSRAAFLGRLEGLVVGENPANGLFRGPLFLHPDLDLALEMPARWKTVNRPDAAGAAAPDGDAAILLHLVGAGSDPVAGARADGLKDAHLKQLQSLKISRLSAARLVADTRDGDRVILTWIVHRQRVFRVTGMTGVRDWPRHGPALERATATFRPLLADDRNGIVESRLRVRPARAGETVREVVTRGGAAWDAARAAVANGTTVDARLDAGWPVKVAVTQRYAGRDAG